MSLPPSPDAPQKTELSVSEPVVTEIVEDTATTITTPDATIDTTSVALPIPKHHPMPVVIQGIHLLPLLHCEPPVAL